MSVDFETFELAARIRRMTPEAIEAVADGVLKAGAKGFDLAADITKWAESLRPADIKKVDA